MKTKIFSTKSLILAIGLILISLVGSAQDNKLSKEERKTIRKDKENFNFQVVDTMLENKNFILEADFLENEYGNRRPVPSDLNFILVDSVNAVLQTGSNRNIGYNGVGGVTAEGSIRGLKLTKNAKNHSYFMSFTVVSDIGIYDIAMTVYADKRARATISGLTMGKLVYDGWIKNNWESRAYKGKNSI